MPRGGLLGFGLAHKYPDPYPDGAYDPSIDYTKFYSLLQAADAIVVNACSTLGLKHSIRIVYIDHEYHFMTKEPINTDEWLTNECNLYCFTNQNFKKDEDAKVL